MDRMQNRDQPPDFTTALPNLHEGRIQHQQHERTIYGYT
ncbi:hypothetical protein FTUN_0505 [Frigoriglobus tundricola]|uniref:Uncharacterized protein n=1 Tax=Frigoriglobus tundricola TaxID=2774151 RepID=A0A6M5YG66_9BACT|nr:hypothetical protein FTUN_0505 [Frigoriglobus tundricola]